MKVCFFCFSGNSHNGETWPQGNVPALSSAYSEFKVNHHQDPSFGMSHRNVNKWPGEVILSMAYGAYET